MHNCLQSCFQLQDGKWQNVNEKIKWNTLISACWIHFEHLHISFTQFNPLLIKLHNDNWPTYKSEVNISFFNGVAANIFWARKFCQPSLFTKLKFMGFLLGR